jgi:cell division protein FtsL
MSTRLAEEELYSRKSYPLLYLVNKQENTGREKVIQSRTGIFYVCMIVVVFACLGLLLNIGLKTQAINYDRKIFENNEMISLEKERADRLKLKISELKNPDRIVDVAENGLGMKMSENIKVMRVVGVNLAKEEKIHDYIAKNPTPELKQYDNFLGTIYSIKDIIMVVSEGVLTFFIP